ncbi:SWIM zinc finger family protein [Streptomyces griseoflavus]|uniref:SWIM zinc finger family protein n=1 Tax=Streptomyces griseoflavus TaxID=35619 RepID=UPI0033E0A283
MTPRPSDEAREALRAARERADREPAADAAGPPAGPSQRPGDAAREALRRARREARPGEAPTAGEDSGTGLSDPSADAGGVRPAEGPKRDDEPPAGARPGTPATGTPATGGAHARAAGAGPAGGASDGTAAAETAAAETVDDAGGVIRAEPPRAEQPARDAARTAATEATPAPAGSVSTPSSGSGASPEAGARGAGAAREGSASGPGDPADTGRGEDGRPDRRPGDIAREALRSARAEAERARAQADDRSGPARRRAAPAPRVPRTTRGDRVAGERAREVRAALADAFRMPTDEDAPRPEPVSEPRPEPVSEARPRRESPASAPAPPAPPASPPETPSAPHAAPRSMAAPARDGDLRRTFPAFPPRTADHEGFAGTWWGRAWVTALEDGALDAARLARGRGYAEQGHVDAITVTPGLVLAYVRGSRPRPYRVQVRLRTFRDADWERFLDAAAERPGHIAALLDNEMPQSLADCGVPLLPGPGDLDPRCSCPDAGHPCKHAAALCYQTARLLDADPFVLLLLRGRGERDVIDALSRLSAARAARAAQEREPEPLPGVRATEAVGRALPPLPAPLPPPPHPEQPPVYPASPGGPDPLALDQLATDAAARAHALLTTGRDPAGGLTLWHDAVRLAAARPGSGLTAATRALYSSLARAAGRTPADLARAVAAWRQGGPTGLAVLEEPWDPPAGRFDRARPLLLAADLPAFRPWRNRLTHPRGHVQLRLGRDHLWYAYESEAGQDDWWPRGTPDPDPVGALTGLDTPGDL